MLNEKFGSWTIIAKDGSKHGHWICRCECGTERSQPYYRLSNGITKSCGCKRSEHTSEGKTKFRGSTPSHKTHPKLYHRWNQMKQRCNNPNVKSYEYYGAKGIKVCERWETSFVNFFEDMGEPPSEKHELDREDDKKDYEPGNVVWRLKGDNIRRRGYTLKIQWNGKDRTMKSVCEELGIKYKSVHMRIKRYGEDPLEAIAHLLHKSRNKKAE